MPHYKILIHLIWATKNRYPYLKGDIKKKVISHILDKANVNGIYIDCIDGVADHIHALIHIRPDQTISGIVHLIKGESSHWINRNKLTLGRFSWQEEYMAFSVSPSAFDPVRKYINQQEKHHQRISCAEELDNFFPGSAVKTAHMEDFTFPRDKSRG